MTTTIEITYACGCTYAVPTTLADDQSALRHATLVDTITVLIDTQHDAACPHPIGKAQP
jgi:hypothetical protein